jgi:hypothetical protein
VTNALKGMSVDQLQRVEEFVYTISSKGRQEEGNPGLHPPQPSARPPSGLKTEGKVDVSNRADTRAESGVGEGAEGGSAARVFID